MTDAPIPSSLADVKAFAQIAANIATVAAAIAAAYWFYWSGRSSRRVEFDANFSVYKCINPEFKVLQVAFLLDNKGQVEHRCYTLAFEVVELDPDGRAISDSSEGFVFRSGNIVDQKAAYYYVRPGVCQRIVHVVSVPAHLKLAKVRAFFTYARQRIDIDPTKPTLSQRDGLPDWTSLVRVVDLSVDSAAH
jgi:hypothetical protein